MAQELFHCELVDDIEPSLEPFVELPTDAGRIS